jgi:eukaryotic-like serine/threonine-protein kinase
MDAMLGRVLGNYELVEKLGSGGMGSVYRGVHKALQQPRAVKLLRPDLANDPDVVKRFQREATISAGLRHPNIVLIYDVGQQDDYHFIVMDLLEGGTLRDVIRSSAPMSVEKAVELLRPLASALDYAHERGVIHRDIKPGNVMVSADNQVTLVDFGIARAAEEARLTRVGTVVGTAEYMSPEAFTNAGSDQSGDRYALGIIAYELLTGQAPFRGSPATVTYAQIHTPPPSPRAIRPGIHPRAEHALLLQLSKDPAGRYQDARRFVEGLAIAIERPVVADAPTIMLTSSGAQALASMSPLTPPPLPAAAVPTPTPASPPPGTPPPLESGTVVHRPPTDMPPSEPADESPSRQDQPIIDPVSRPEQPIPDPVSRTDQPVADPASQRDQPIADPDSRHDEPVSEPVSRQDQPVPPPTSRTNHPVPPQVSRTDHPLPPPISRTDNQVRDDAAQPPESATTSAADHEQEGDSRNRLLVLALVILAILVIGGIVLLLR